MVRKNMLDLLCASHILLVALIVSVHTNEKAMKKFSHTHIYKTGRYPRAYPKTIIGGRTPYLQHVVFLNHTRHNNLHLHHQKKNKVHGIKLKNAQNLLLFHTVNKLNKPKQEKTNLDPLDINRKKHFIKALIPEQSKTANASRKDQVFAGKYFETGGFHEFSPFENTRRTYLNLNLNHEDDEEGIDDRRSVTGKPNDHIVQANEKEMIVSNGQMSDNKPIEFYLTENNADVNVQDDATSKDKKDTTKKENVKKDVPDSLQLGNQEMRITEVVTPTNAFVSGSEPSANNVAITGAESNDDKKAERSSEVQVIPSTAEKYIDHYDNTAQQSQPPHPDLTQDAPSISSYNMNVQNPLHDQILNDVQNPSHDQITMDVQKPSQDQAVIDVQNPFHDQAVRDVQRPSQDQAVRDVQRPSQDQAVRDVQRPSQGQAIGDVQKSSPDQEAVLDNKDNNIEVEHNHIAGGVYKVVDQQPNTQINVQDIDGLSEKMSLFNHLLKKLHGDNVQAESKNEGELAVNYSEKQHVAPTHDEHIQPEIQQEGSTKFQERPSVKVIEGDQSMLTTLNEEQHEPKTEIQFHPDERIIENGPVVQQEEAKPHENEDVIQPEETQIQQTQQIVQDKNGDKPFLYPFDKNTSPIFVHETPIHHYMQPLQVTSNIESGKQVTEMIDSQTSNPSKFPTAFKLTKAIMSSARLMDAPLQHDSLIQEPLNINGQNLIPGVFEAFSKTNNDLKERYLKLQTWARANSEEAPVNSVKKQLKNLNELSDMVHLVNNLEKDMLKTILKRKNEMNVKMGFKHQAIPERYANNQSSQENQLSQTNQSAETNETKRFKNPNDVQDLLQYIYDTYIENRTADEIPVVLQAFQKSVTDIVSKKNVSSTEPGGSNNNDLIYKSIKVLNQENQYMNIKKESGDQGETNEYLYKDFSSRKDIYSNDVENEENDNENDTSSVNQNTSFSNQLTHDFRNDHRLTQFLDKKNNFNSPVITVKLLKALDLFLDSIEIGRKIRKFRSKVEELSESFNGSVILTSNMKDSLGLLNKEINETLLRSDMLTEHAYTASSDRVGNTTNIEPNLMTENNITNLLFSQESNTSSLSSKNESDSKLNDSNSSYSVVNDLTEDVINSNDKTLSNGSKKENDTKLAEEKKSDENQSANNNNKETAELKLRKEDADLMPEVSKASSNENLIPQNQTQYASQNDKKNDAVKETPEPKTESSDKMLRQENGSQESKNNQEEKEVQETNNWVVKEREEENKGQNSQKQKEKFYESNKLLKEQENGYGNMKENQKHKKKTDDYGYDDNGKYHDTTKGFNNNLQYEKDWYSKAEAKDNVNISEIKNNHTLWNLKKPDKIPPVIYLDSSQSPYDHLNGLHVNEQQPDLHGSFNLNNISQLSAEALTKQHEWINKINYSKYLPSQNNIGHNESYYNLPWAQVNMTALNKEAAKGAKYANEIHNKKHAKHKKLFNEEVKKIINTALDEAKNANESSNYYYEHELNLNDHFDNLSNAPAQQSSEGSPNPSSPEELSMDGAFYKGYKNIRNALLSNGIDKETLNYTKDALKAENDYISNLFYEENNATSGSFRSNLSKVQEKSNYGYYNKGLHQQWKQKDYAQKSELGKFDDSSYYKKNNEGRTDMTPLNDDDMGLEETFIQAADWDKRNIDFRDKTDKLDDDDTTKIENLRLLVKHLQEESDAAERDVAEGENNGFGSNKDHNSRSDSEKTADTRSFEIKTKTGNIKDNKSVLDLKDEPERNLDYKRENSIKGNQINNSKESSGIFVINQQATKVSDIPRYSKDTRLLHYSQPSEYTPIKKNISLSSYIGENSEKINDINDKIDSNENKVPSNKKEVSNNSEGATGNKKDETVLQKDHSQLQSTLIANTETRSSDVDQNLDNLEDELSEIRHDKKTLDLVDQVVNGNVDIEKITSVKKKSQFDKEGTEINFLGTSEKKENENLQKIKEKFFTDDFHKKDELNHDTGDSINNFDKWIDGTADNLYKSTAQNVVNKINDLNFMDNFSDEGRTYFPPPPVYMNENAFKRSSIKTKHFSSRKKTRVNKKKHNANSKYKTLNIKKSNRAKIPLEKKNRKLKIKNIRNSKQSPIKKKIAEKNKIVIRNVKKHLNTTSELKKTKGKKSKRLKSVHKRHKRSIGNSIEIKNIFNADRAHRKHHKRRRVSKKVKAKQQHPDNPALETLFSIQKLQNINSKKTSYKPKYATQYFNNNATGDINLRKQTKKKVKSLHRMARKKDVIERHIISFPYEKISSYRPYFNKRHHIWLDTDLDVEYDWKNTKEIKKNIISKMIKSHELKAIEKNLIESIKRNDIEKGKDIVIKDIIIKDSFLKRLTDEQQHFVWQILQSAYDQSHTNPHIEQKQTDEGPTKHADDFLRSFFQNVTGINTYDRESANHDTRMYNKQNNQTNNQKSKNNINVKSDPVKELKKELNHAGIESMKNLFANKDRGIGNLTLIQNDNINITKSFEEEEEFVNLADESEKNDFYFKNEDENDPTVTRAKYKPKKITHRRVFGQTDKSDKAHLRSLFDSKSKQENGNATLISNASSANNITENNITRDDNSTSGKNITKEQLPRKYEKTEEPSNKTSESAMNATDIQSTGHFEDSSVVIDNNTDNENFAKTKGQTVDKELKKKSDDDKSLNSIEELKKYAHESYKDEKTKSKTSSDPGKTSKNNTKSEKARQKTSSRNQYKEHLKEELIERIHQKKSSKEAMKGKVHVHVPKGNITSKNNVNNNKNNATYNTNNATYNTNNATYNTNNATDNTNNATNNTNKKQNETRVVERASDSNNSKENGLLNSSTSNVNKTIVAENKKNSQTVDMMNSTMLNRSSDLNNSRNGSLSELSAEEKLSSSLFQTANQTKIVEMERITKNKNGSENVNKISSIKAVKGEQSQETNTYDITDLSGDSDQLDNVLFHNNSVNQIKNETLKNNSSIELFSHKETTDKVLIPNKSLSNMPQTTNRKLVINGFKTKSTNASCKHNYSITTDGDDIFHVPSSKCIEADSTTRNIVENTTNSKTVLSSFIVGKKNDKSDCQDDYIVINKEGFEYRIPTLKCFNSDEKENHPNISLLNETVTTTNRSAYNLTKNSNKKTVDSIHESMKNQTTCEHPIYETFVDKDVEYRIQVGCKKNFDRLVEAFQKMDGSTGIENQIKNKFFSSNFSFPKSNINSSIDNITNANETNGKLIYKGKNLIMTQDKHGGEHILIKGQNKTIEINYPPENAINGSIVLKQGRRLYKIPTKDLKELNETKFFSNNNNEESPWKPDYLNSILANNETFEIKGTKVIKETYSNGAKVINMEKETARLSIYYPPKNSSDAFKDAGFMVLKESGKTYKIPLENSNTLLNQTVLEETKDTNNKESNIKEPKSKSIEEKDQQAKTGEIKSLSTNLGNTNGLQVETAEGRKFHNDKYHYKEMETKFDREKKLLDSNKNIQKEHLHLNYEGDAKLNQNGQAELKLPIQKNYFTNRIDKQHKEVEEDHRLYPLLEQYLETFRRNGKEPNLSELIKSWKQNQEVGSTNSAYRDVFMDQAFNNPTLGPPDKNYLAKLDRIIDDEHLSSAPLNLNQLDLVQDSKPAELNDPTQLQYVKDNLKDNILERNMQKEVMGLTADKLDKTDKDQLEQFGYNANDVSSFNRQLLENKSKMSEGEFGNVGIDVNGKKMGNVGLLLNGDQMDKKHKIHHHETNKKKVQQLEML